MLWCAFHVVKSTGSWGGGWAADRWGPRTVLIVAWSVYGVIYAGFAFATSPWHVWVLFVAYGLYHALSEPAEKAWVARMAPVLKRGGAFGWYHLVQGFALLLAGLLMGLWYEMAGPVAAFLWGAALAWASVLVLLTVLRKT